MHLQSIFLKEFNLDILFLPLGYLMGACYDLLNNYALTILAFTIVTKIVLLPLAVWVHKNSIKLIKMQPSINKIKLNYYGNSERIAEEQSVLFKKEKYSPLYDLIPLFIQITLLIAVIQILYNPLSYILNIPSDVIAALINKTAELTMMDPQIASAQVVVLNTIQNSNFTNDYLALTQIENIDTYISQINSINTDLFGFNLSETPIEVMGAYLFVPILAGFSSFLLSFAQNKVNVLQSEQSRALKYSTAGISIALSLYLGVFVPTGVALYWVISNLYAIIQLFILNYTINPKKFIDYDELNNSRDELNKLKTLTSKKQSIFKKDPNSQKEKKDYKRFFSVQNKKLAFYSEHNGFYKYYKGIIEFILSKSNITIHYICRDPNDDMFTVAQQNEKIKAYYIGDTRLITLMMKLDCDVMVMTTPDIENYHIKRSYVKKDIEYIFTEHGIGSPNLLYNKNALAHFDTIFCVGQYQVDELSAQEQMYTTKKKNLIKTGYILIDEMIKTYEESKKIKNTLPVVLVAPSWQRDNIMDSCLDDIIKSVINCNYQLIIRPHPQYVRLYPEKMNAIINKYENLLSDNFKIETDFSSNSTVYSSDVLITDWSAIGYEFSFTTCKPTIYINTPMKIQNPDFEKLGIEPVDFSLRQSVGKAVDLKDVVNINETIHDMLAHGEKYKNEIIKCRQNNIFNLGNSAEVAGAYILNTLIEKQKNKTN